MIKEHPVAATIVAAALGAAVVIGGYALTRSEPKVAPQGTGLQLRENGKGVIPRKVARVKKIDPAANPGVPQQKGVPGQSVDLKSVPQIPSNLPDKAELQEQFKMLRSFLELPPERLAKIHTSIEKIEAMPPEQKARLLALIRQNDKPSAKGRNAAASEARANELLAAMPPEIRALLTYRTKDYTPEQRATFIEGYAAACKDAASANQKPQAALKSSK
jgi:hypothetical protein